jgi:hypothetical protein
MLAGTYKENSQILNEDFYLLLYLPLWHHGFRTIYGQSNVGAFFG